MKHRERPPVGEQGRSPRYRPADYSTPRPVSARTAAVLWAVQVVLIGTYATLLTIHLVSPSFPSVVNPLVPFAITLVNYGLVDRSRVRPVPSRAQKVVSVLSLGAAFTWLIVVVALIDRTTTSSPVVPFAVWVVSFGLLLTAMVSAYRARDFHWKNDSNAS